MERKEDESLYFMDRIWVPLVGDVRMKALGTRLDLSTAYHPQTDRQSERIIQTLEDMLRAYVIDFGGSWDVHLQFSYNNSYHSSIRCAPFEALYGRKCRSPVLWAEIGEGSLIGPELVLEMTDKVVLIKEKLKAARDRQKSYTDKRRKPLEFKVGDQVLEKVSPWKGVVHFRKKGKLTPRYVGPFEILERIGLVAYRLRLPEELSSVHDTFHVSNLKKCLADANLHVPLDEIKVDKTLRFVEEPVEIMDREIKKLKRRKIALVKVRWNSKRGPEFTWEHEDEMRIKYPQLLVVNDHLILSVFVFGDEYSICSVSDNEGMAYFMQCYVNNFKPPKPPIAVPNLVVFDPRNKSELVVYVKHSRNWKLRFEHSGGLLAGIHGLFSGRYCGLVRRVTCGYPWPELEGNHRDFGMIRERLRSSAWCLSD
ncbi:putative reverse transcriptase domain-containing protein [Tanacetum coccineum]|uniref:Reverse transcriptase domain-containing protein n=1 Tax=Tanacetum coccineum TaxID=301880 RepID=A0ABQ5FAY7_9ASTR